MKSLGFTQDITLRFKFADGVDLEAAEHALLTRAYHTKSAVQMAYDICATWRTDMSRWLDKHLVGIRHDPYSNTLIVHLKTHSIAASEFVGLILDVLTVLIAPVCRVGPMPDAYPLLHIRLFVQAYQPAWVASLLGEEEEGAFEATLYPLTEVKLLSFPWEEGA